MLALDRKIASAIFVATCLIYWHTYSYPSEIVAFPRFILVVMGLLSLLLFFFPRQQQGMCLGEIFSRERVATMALVIAYAVVFPYLGYFVTTFVFAVLYLWLFERRGLGRYVLYSAIFCLIMYAVFQKFLFIWFPEGILI